MNNYVKNVGGRGILEYNTGGHRGAGGKNRKKWFMQYGYISLSATFSKNAKERNSKMGYQGYTKMEQSKYDFKKEEKQNLILLKC